jgi:hypothetical protein
MSGDLIETVMEGKRAAASDAAPDRASEPYRPGSGTEGMGFDEMWCNHCARDAAYRDGGPDADPALGCQILADTFAYEITHPKYPKEWIYGRDGRPCCTAFATDPSTPLRCEKTLDLFGSTGAPTVHARAEP